MLVVRGQYEGDCRVFNRKSEPKAHDFAPAREPMTDIRPMPQGLATMPVTLPADEAGDSVIGSDLSIEGQAINIRCKGLLRINGQISADLHSRKLIVGQNGYVQGSINADEVSIHGRVGGAINGGRVVLHATAHVEGDIHSRSLSIEDGATFDGRSRKVSDADAQRADSQPSPVAQIMPPPRLHA